MSALRQDSYESINAILCGLYNLSSRWNQILWPYFYIINLTGTHHQFSKTTNLAIFLAVNYSIQYNYLHTTTFKYSNRYGSTYSRGYPISSRLFRFHSVRCCTRIPHSTLSQCGLWGRLKSSVVARRRRKAQGRDAGEYTVVRTGHLMLHFGTRIERSWYRDSTHPLKPQLTSTAS